MIVGSMLCFNHFLPETSWLYLLFPDLLRYWLSDLVHFTKVDFMRTIITYPENIPPNLVQLLENLTWHRNRDM
uniref:Putative ovule protein n=1 Tax=Solanum chacoense TaxID=4108 RepID=A0A0V0H8E9_SOLCH